jgi:hypothetical protein
MMPILANITAATLDDRLSRCLPSRAVVHGFRQCSNVLAGIAQGDELAANAGRLFAVAVT